MPDRPARGFGYATHNNPRRTERAWLVIWADRFQQCETAVVRDFDKQRPPSFGQCETGAAATRVNIARESTDRCAIYRPIEVVDFTGLEPGSCDIVLVVD
jgi:hypothetical protein